MGHSVKVQEVLLMTTSEERRQRWAAIAAKGKTRWIVLRGIIGFGLTLTAFTFLEAWIVDRSVTGFRQICSDLVVRTFFCLVGGYLFGLVTWKWFTYRHAPSKQ